MFADPTVAFMSMLMLFFVGMMCVFFFLMRAISAHRLEMRESFRKQQQMLTDLEGQIMELSFGVRSMKEAPPPAERPTPVPTVVKSPLSFLDADDNILSLLDEPLRAPVTPAPLPEPTLPNFEDRLFSQPPAPGRTILDDYGFNEPQASAAASAQQGVRASRPSGGEVAAKRGFSL